MKKKIRDFVVNTMGGMASGLFATLIIGTILATIGRLFENGDDAFSKFVLSILGSSKVNYGASYVLQVLTGAGIGVGIALALKLDTLKTIVLGVVGEFASYFSLTMQKENGMPLESNSFKVGDPLTIYLVCISVALLFILIFKKKTPVDLLLVPLFGCFLGLVISLLLRYPASYITYGVQWIVAKATIAAPFLMGIIVSTVTGMALTAPISSAAICAVIFTGNLEGLALASGAAVIGCSTQMVGFAIQSRKDNSIGEVISIGIGTSMFQFKNIIKKPIIWLPTIIASAILGPISTCLLPLECAGASAGMGTAGLVGQIGTIISSGNTPLVWLKMLGLEIIGPAVLVLIIDLIFRKFNLIKLGDLSLKEE